MSAPTVERTAEDVVAVTVTSFRLDCSRPELAALDALLSAKERARAGRFRFERDAARYVAGRGQLRRALGALVDTPPERLAFRYGPFGKPELAQPACAGRLGFNLSHAGALAVLAVTDGATVGVDVERCSPVADRDLVAEHFFSAREVADLAALAPHERDAGFLRCWTRKEAYLKAVGGGLSVDLRSFAVSLAPAGPAELVWATDPAVRSTWALADVSACCPGHLAAVAVSGATADVTFPSQPEEGEQL